MNKIVSHSFREMEPHHECVDLLRDVSLFNLTSRLSARKSPRLAI